MHLILGTAKCDVLRGSTTDLNPQRAARYGILLLRMADIEIRKEVSLEPCYLLSLPLELREMIFVYALPYTK